MSFVSRLARLTPRRLLHSLDEVERLHGQVDGLETRVRQLIAAHESSEKTLEQLRTALTTFSMDRRGFGASGDAAGYAIEREFEDVAAVVEAVAARTGGPVALWGHSYGAGCAMGGAALTACVHPLVLYEPGLGIAYPAGSIPGARVQVLEGHAHLAYRTDPAMVAAVIRRFVSGRGCRGCGRPRRS